MTDREMIEKLHDVLRVSGLTHNDLEMLSGINRVTFEAWFRGKYGALTESLIKCLAPLGLKMIVKRHGVIVRYEVRKVDEILGEIRAAMYERGMSIQQVADEAGVSVNPFYLWYYTDTRPSLSVLSRVARAVGVELEVVMD